jgi:uncharacterized protein (DUF1501 family)
VSPSVPKVVLAESFSSTRDTIVVIFLRGGADGLSLIVPHGDPNYYNPGLRPGIAVPSPGDPGGAVDLDGFFGLNPAMASLLPAYQNGDLLPIHATGSPDPTRSHFDAFRFMEFGQPLQPISEFSGWLARHLLVTPPASNGPLRAIALNDLVPQTLIGAPNTLPVADPASFAFPGRTSTATDRANVLEAVFADANEPIKSAGQNTIDTIDLLTQIDFDNYTPANGALYPGGSFGNAMASVSALIKADIGVEAAMLELGGWDSHEGQVGQVTGLMSALSTALSAFHSDTQDHMNQITLVVMSEFGRRADENGSAGTDHGHGNCMLTMGGGIAGGQVLADWTSGELLHPDLLHQGDSLQVTIDYRDVLAEILQNRLQNTDLGAVFPNHAPMFHGVTV